LFRQLLSNISEDPESNLSQIDKGKINETLYNITQNRGICLLGQPRDSEHPYRAAFSKFIRVAQHKIFNPDRPKITGIVSR
jgi:hypothetical protein